MNNPKPPTVADPGRVAVTQGDLNRDTAVTQSIMNNTDQITPDGQLRYTKQDYQQFIPEKFDDKGVKIPGTGIYVNTPKWTATQTLSQAQQKIKGLSDQTSINMGTIGRDQSSKIGALLNTNFNQDGSLDRDRVEKALNDRMNPQLQKQRTALHDSLINRGMREGTQAYNDAIDGAGRQENDARLAVIAQGGNEQNQAIQRAKAIRSTPIDEINALMSGSQVAQPQFTNTPNVGVAGVDYQGGVQNRDNVLMQQYQSKVQRNNAMMGGLFGLGSAAVKFSDRRLKKNIVRLGTLPNGLNVYRYSMIWDDERHVGVMADEVMAIAPHAVHRNSSGFDVVDYGSLAA
jgi:Chaperone of endosialidase